MEEGRVSEEFPYEGFPWKIVSKVINGRDKEELQQRIKKVIFVLDTEKSPNLDQIDSTFIPLPVHVSTEMIRTSRCDPNIFPDLLPFGLIIFVNFLVPLYQLSTSKKKTKTASWIPFYGPDRSAFQTHESRQRVRYRKKQDSILLPFDEMSSRVPNTSGICYDWSTGERTSWDLIATCSDNVSIPEE